MDSLPGKDNKKARNAKSREIAELKKDANFVDAERILVGKEPITPSNKTPQNSKPKGGEYDDLFASADAGKNYVAAVSTELVFTSKKKKDKPAKGLSEKELEDMEKLKQNIMTKKSELKAEGMSGGQINKNSDIVDWVAKLNALKEKEAALKGNMTEKEAQGGHGEEGRPEGDRKASPRHRGLQGQAQGGVRVHEAGDQQRPGSHGHAEAVQGDRGQVNSWRRRGSLCGSPPRTRWHLMSDLAQSCLQQH